MLLLQHQAYVMSVCVQVYFGIGLIYYLFACVCLVIIILFPHSFYAWSIIFFFAFLHVVSDSITFISVLHCVSGLWMICFYFLNNFCKLNLKKECPWGSVAWSQYNEKNVVLFLF